MKSYFRIIVLSVIALFAVSVNLEAAGKKKVAEVTFMVEIDCPSCAKKIEANLPFEKGIKDLKVDIKAQTVWLSYRTSKTNEQKIKDAIIGCGTKVLGVKPIEAKEEVK